MAPALALCGVLALAAAAGHAVDVHAHLLKPRFDHPSQYIRYHDTFHDGHGHSQSPGSGPQWHVHDPHTGRPVTPPVVFTPFGPARTLEEARAALAATRPASDLPGAAPPHQPHEPAAHGHPPHQPDEDGGPQQ